MRKGKRGAGAGGLWRGREGVARREEARRKVCGRSDREERPGAGRSLQTFSSRALWEVAMV